MLTCIACSKHQHQQHQQINNGSLRQQLQEEDDVGTPRTKQAIKALTSQVTCLFAEKMRSNLRNS